MTWYISGLIAAISFAILFLCYNKLKDSLPIGTYMFYISFISGAIILFFLDNITMPATYLILIIIASILSWSGMFFYNMALKKENNIGYIEATFSTRIPLIYLLSVLYFDSEIDYFKLLPLALMILGLLIINDFNPFNFQLPKSKAWILYASLASISTVGMTGICKVLLEAGVRAELLTAWILIISAFIFLFSSIIRKEKMSINKSSYNILIVAIIMTCIGNISMFTSYNKAPNLSYVSSLLSFRVVLLYGATVFLKYDKFELKKAFAVLICFISICLF